MRNKDYFKGKNVLVVGLARSGLACANLLSGLGAQVSITDSKDSDATRGNLAKLKSGKINVELGAHSQGFVKGKDLVIISPGVPAFAPPIVWARQFNIPVISEIEFAWILCPATVIAVTGSNGKTTVTTLIGMILEAAGKKAVVCGNIGNPFSAEVDRVKESDFVVLEVSSFQLETIQKFKPKISVLLNFTRNHLDRYNNMQEYLEAKKRIFMNQGKGDYLVLNEEDTVISKLCVDTKADTVYFSRKGPLNPNHAAVLAVGLILGIDKELILSVFKEFRGIEHRMEFVAEINKIKFINDSKATTADSTLWALKNIPGKVILIAGGKHKGVDYGVISDQARSKVKSAILIGEAKEKIAQALKGSSSTEEARTLEEAVRKAFLKASPGDYVLLSPMCSSFDMFSNYQERGDCFKKAVYGLINSKG